MFEIVENFKQGISGYRELILTSLIQDYLDIELHFASKMPFAEILMKVRQHFANDTNKVYETVISHQGVAKKSNLIIKMLDNAKDPRSQYDGLSKDARNKARKASKLLNLLTGLSSLSKNGSGVYAPGPGVFSPSFHARPRLNSSERSACELKLISPLRELLLWLEVACVARLR